ncbi:MAG: SUMF1/EgtB/PvdO family nonheme iron enzyme [Odoribacter sp.]|nr:SUMF1/EgtB/PvdO family nonheme iron enzyme [Odoribacter sp.]
MNMKRLVILVWFACSFWGVRANNVRIVEDIKVGTIEGSSAQLTFKIAWDNSWRDDYNWDAVYVFMKIKRTTELEWKHAYFMDANHSFSAGYTCWPAQYTTTANYRQGVFIYRNSKGKGDVEVTANLLWNISAAGYSAAEIQAGKIEMSLQCIEMVYVPQGAYYLGDGVSTKTFRKKLRQILPEWDLIDSHDPTQKFTASPVSSSIYSVTGPANRVSEDINNGGATTANTYYSYANVEGFWQVEFATPKTVRYFGVSGLYGHGNHRPTEWYLAGSNTGVDWTELSDRYTAAQWLTEGDSYPVYNALPLKKGYAKPYKFYRIVFKAPGSYGVMLANVAMTEKDLSTVSDDGYVVDGRAMALNETTGLFADDGYSWSGTLTGSSNDGAKYTGDVKVYPNGFEGFYVMKYELSQEQYVRFLNKLNANQQKARTVDILDDLDPGDYVFGEDKTQPENRNGIVLGARSNGVVIFACNLTKAGDKVSQENDGQNVACNYVSINDMLAYADWAGLRPLSEMEFEKMGRRPYPQLPERKGWAGGDMADAKYPTAGAFADGTTPGGEDERLVSGNVNAGGKTDGPVRVGSFAPTAKTPQQAGSSYWGVMELSGNLAEYYYNAAPAGRAFYDRTYGSSHGDGAIAASGAENVGTAYWPETATAFCIRGGSYMSEVQGAEGQISISDRSQIGSMPDMNTKNATTTFRLGHSYTFLTSPRITCNSYLRLNNGKTTASGEVADSVCVGEDYTLRGSELLDASGSPIDGGGKVSYIWYRRNGSTSATWQIIPNENGRDLVLRDLRSDRRDVTVNGQAFQYFYVRRMAYTPNGAMHMTYPAKILMINPQYSFDRLVDTLRQNNTSLGFLLRTGLAASVSWSWKAGGDDAGKLSPYYSNGSTRFLYIPQRTDFGNVAGQTHVVVCELTYFNKCKKREELKVFVEKRPEVGVASNEITVNGKDPSKECGVVMQDMRSQGASRVYKTVKVNGKCWMAENLRYDGLPSESGIKTDDPSGEKYGRLYKWSETIKNNACPSGWRLPTNAEVDALIASLGGEYAAGPKVKAINYWQFNEGIQKLNTTGLSFIGAMHNINIANNPTDTYIITQDNYYYFLNWSNDRWGKTNWASSYYMPIRCIKR